MVEHAGAGHLAMAGSDHGEARLLVGADGVSAGAAGRIGGGSTISANADIRGREIDEAAGSASGMGARAAGRAISGSGT